MILRPANDFFVVHSLCGLYSLKWHQLLNGFGALARLAVVRRGHQWNSEEEGERKEGRP